MAFTRKFPPNRVFNLTQENSKIVSGPYGEPVNMAFCDDHLNPHAKFTLYLGVDEEMEGTTKISRPTPIPRSEPEAQKIRNEMIMMGDRVLYLIYQGSSLLTIQNQAYINAARKGMISMGCGAFARINVKSTGLIELDMNMTDQFEYSTGNDVYRRQDRSHGVNWTTIPGRSLMCMDVDEHLDFEKGFQTALAHLYLNFQSSEYKGVLPISGIVIFTDTEPNCERPLYPELENIPIKIFGLWTGTQEGSMIENNALKKKVNLIPYANFESALKTWDPEACVITNSFLGAVGLASMTSFTHRSIDDKNKDDEAMEDDDDDDEPAEEPWLKKWQHVEIGPANGWHMIIKPWNHAGAFEESAEIIHTSISLNLLSDKLHRQIMFRPNSCLEIKEAVKAGELPAGVDDKNIFHRLIHKRDMPRSKIWADDTDTGLVDTSQVSVGYMKTNYPSTEVISFSTAFAYLPKPKKEIKAPKPSPIPKPSSSSTAPGALKPDTVTTPTFSNKKILVKPGVVKVMKSVAPTAVPKNPPSSSSPTIPLAKKPSIMKSVNEKRNAKAAVHTKSMGSYFSNPKDEKK